MLPDNPSCRRFRRPILAYTSNEQAAAGRARSAALDRRAGSGSGSTNIGPAGAQTACRWCVGRRGCWFAYTHKYVAVLLVAIRCIVDINTVDMNVIVSWHIETWSDMACSSLCQRISQKGRSRTDPALCSPAQLDGVDTAFAMGSANGNAKRPVSEVASSGGTSCHQVIIEHPRVGCDTRDATHPRPVLFRASKKG